jgi:hypothetical protein
MRTVLWRRFRIDYPNSNRIAGFRQGKEFSHGLGGFRAFAGTYSGDKVALSSQADLI